MEVRLRTSSKKSRKRPHVTASLIDFLKDAGYEYINKMKLPVHIW